MATEDNDQVELKSSNRKVEPNFHNEIVLKNPSTDFSTIVNLGNSIPPDGAAVS